MKLFLISDNHDTLTGMRLAGVEGVVVHDEEGVKKALDMVLADPQIGMLLITSMLTELCPQYILQLKLERRTPLIVTIPDRHSGVVADMAISNYIRQALGGSGADV